MRPFVSLEPWEGVCCSLNSEVSGGGGVGGVGVGNTYAVDVLSPSD